MVAILFREDNFFMVDKGPQIGDLLLNGRYELLQQVKGAVGRPRTYLGTKGVCRYCGTHDLSLFRKLAHTFPEALGNKSVFSRDECDRCNGGIFSLYDEELTKAVSPFITLGGIEGKGNKVRATGRSSGGSFVEQRRSAGKRSIFSASHAIDPKDAFAADATGRNVRLTTPIAPVPFKPRYAYKALAKMGVALLPQEEIKNYQKLIAWLLNPQDAEDFPVLEVGFSYGSVGNAPPFVTGQLFRRVKSDDCVPHILFLFCAGSVCMQIDLLSDHMEDHIGLVPRGSVKIEYSTVIGPNEEVRIKYSAPTYMNWSSSVVTPQPVESMVLHFDTVTTEGHFTPVFRKQT
jgi:hypothetical protein